MSNIFFSNESSNNVSGVLIQFKAGRMNEQPNSRMVVADTRKGLIIVKKTLEDGLIHFMWQDAETKVIDTDLIIFPGDSTFTRVTECPSSYVFLLRFKSSKLRLFFWLQESNKEGDEFCSKVNNFLNKPEVNPSLDSTNQLLIKRLFESGVDTSEAVRLLNSVNLPNQSSSMLTLSSPSSPSFDHEQGGTYADLTSSIDIPMQHSESEPQPYASNDDPLTERDLIDIFQTSSTSSYPNPASSFNLLDILNLDAILSTNILSDEEVVKQLQIYLPQDSGETIPSTLTCDQFKSAANVLSRALCQGNLADILTSLGLKHPSVPISTNIEGFLMAIQEQSNEENHADL